MLINQSSSHPLELQLQQICSTQFLASPWSSIGDTSVFFFFFFLTLNMVFELRAAFSSGWPPWLLLLLRLCILFDYCHPSSLDDRHSCALLVPPLLHVASYTPSPNTIFFYCERKLTFIFNDIYFQFMKSLDFINWILELYVAYW